VRPWGKHSLQTGHVHEGSLQAVSGTVLQPPVLQEASNPSDSSCLRFNSECVLKCIIAEVFKGRSGMHGKAAKQMRHTQLLSASGTSAEAA
jgi:hypothetical protein